MKTTLILAMVIGGCGGEIDTKDERQKTQAPYGLAGLLVGETGNGTITSTPALVNCASGSCSYRVTQGTRLTLRANPIGGVNFRSWSDAYCAASQTCSVTVGWGTVIMGYFGCVPGATDTCGCPGEPCCDDACGNGLSCQYDWDYNRTCQ